MASRAALNQIVLNINPANILPPKKGRLLVAKPFMDDTYFRRMVILICDHNDESTFGFILNKYVDLQLTEVMPNSPIRPESLTIGGPVETDHIYYIHRYGAQVEGSEQILENIYMGGEFNALTRILESSEADPEGVRYFLGYSGWDSGQLETELTAESWYVAESDGIDIMSFEKNRDTLWGDVLRKMGGDFVNLANFPYDPTLN